MSGSYTGSVDDLRREAYRLASSVESEFYSCASSLVKMLKNLVLEFANVNADVVLDITEYDRYRSGRYEPEHKTIVLNVFGNDSIVHLINTLMHEARHAQQHRKLGDMYVPKYLEAESIHGYMRNPFQVDARTYASKMVPEIILWFYSKIGRKGLDELDRLYQCISESVYNAHRLSYKAYYNAIGLESNSYDEKEIERIKSYISEARENLNKMIDCCRKMNEILKAVVGSV